MSNPIELPTIAPEVRRKCLEELLHQYHKDLVDCDIEERALKILALDPKMDEQVKVEMLTIAMRRMHSTYKRKLIVDELGAAEK